MKKTSIVNPGNCPLSYVAIGHCYVLDIKFALATTSCVIIIVYGYYLYIEKKRVTNSPITYYKTSVVYIHVSALCMSSTTVFQEDLFRQMIKGNVRLTLWACASNETNYMSVKFFSNGCPHFFIRAKSTSHLPVLNPYIDQ